MKFLLAGLLVGSMSLTTYADVLFSPRTGLSDKEFKNLVATENIEKIIPQINVYKIKTKDNVNVLKRFKSDKRVAFAEIDQAVPHDLVPTDPNYLVSGNWYQVNIGAPTAWDSTTGSNIIYAVLDSGVLASHEDLYANIIGGYNFYDNNSDYNDYTGHGTMVTGVVAMMLNNGAGSVGVAPAVSVYALRIADLEGYGYYSTMAAALTWAADNGARVANISYANAHSSFTVGSAADYFKNKNNGLVFASAGNTSGYIEAPVNPSTIAVAATTSTNVRASFSSYGNYVDLAAPGSTVYSTLRTGGYGNVSGTSFSSPIAGAVGALVMSVNPALNSNDIEDILKITATDLGTVGWDQYYGYGKVNAAAAVALAKTYVSRDVTPPTVRLIAPIGGSFVNGLVPIDVSASDIESGISRVEVLGMIDSVAPYNFIWDTTGLSGSQTITAYAYDNAGNYASTSINVTIGFSNPPVITKFTIDKTKISIAATDDVAVTKVELYINGKLVVTGVNTINFNWRKYPSGQYTLTAVALDGDNNRTSVEKTFTK